MGSPVIQRQTRPKLRFTLQEADRAFKNWAANCGPNALAAGLNLSLREVRKAVIDTFNGWMNPTQMTNALKYFGIDFAVEKNLQTKELRSGIGYIQWDGEWVRSSFRQARYKHTHWIASRGGWVFDDNASTFGWLSEQAWRADIEAFVAEEDYEGWFFWQWYEF